MIKLTVNNKISSHTSKLRVRQFTLVCIENPGVRKPPPCEWCHHNHQPLFQYFQSWHVFCAGIDLKGFELLIGQHFVDIVGEGGREQNQLWCSMNKFWLTWFCHSKAQKAKESLKITHPRHFVRICHLTREGRNSRKKNRLPKKVGGKSDSRDECKEGARVEDGWTATPVAWTEAPVGSPCASGKDGREKGGGGEKWGDC